MLLQSRSGSADLDAWCSLVFAGRQRVLADGSPSWPAAGCALRPCIVRIFACRPAERNLRVFEQCLSASCLSRSSLVARSADHQPQFPAAQELDLTGSREFLTKETAEELLAPMLASGAKITKARCSRAGGLCRAAPSALAQGSAGRLPGLCMQAQRGSAGGPQRAASAPVRPRRRLCALRRWLGPCVPRAGSGVLPGCLPHHECLSTQQHLLGPLQIRFSTKSFGVDAAEVAARAIGNVAGTLVDADMSDIIAGRPGKKGLGGRRAARGSCTCRAVCRLRAQQPSQILCMTWCRRGRGACQQEGESGVLARPGLCGRCMQAHTLHAFSTPGCELR